MPILIREHVPLRDLTTFRIGGPARYFCTVTSEAELAEALAWARASKNGNRKTPIPFFILGGGSNILISDAGFEGLVIQMELKGISYDDEKSGGGTVRVTAGAGENWDAFVGACVERGLGGLENLSGIPGTVGAAPVQNIGAYGAEVSQTIDSVRVFDTGKNAFFDLSNVECRFQYRDSVFKHEKNQEGAARYVIVSVAFTVKKSGPVNIEYKDIRDYFLKRQPSGTDIIPDSASVRVAVVRSAVLAIRAAKLPDVTTVGTAGSFFKNPVISREHFAGLAAKYPGLPSFPAENAAKADAVKVPLAWILDHVCGYKGVEKGRVGTYKNQALVIVNTFSKDAGVDGPGGSASASEIKNFAAEIAAKVLEKTGIEIEPEVQYVG